MEHSPQQTNDTKKRGVYIEDSLWFALQSELRSHGSDVSKWFRAQARKYLADKQQESQEADKKS